MILSSNMTAAEHLRINGKLPEHLIPNLVIAEERVRNLEGVAAYIDEAMAQFPDEDCLSEPIEDLQRLAKRLRGENRSTLLSIIEDMTNLEQRLANDADYGMGELRAALKMLGEA